ncbi:MAG TPA: hypothetical protein VKB79_19115 [Bryobacteraceae bacterium]|nr:hypothetical protein [Bryobacteraceae bacterium]
MFRRQAVLLLVAAASIQAQSVVSVRSGVINYSEGAVFVDNQLVGQKPGKYPVLHEGSDLLTHDGRAEILLTPDAYLRVGVDSGVRMVSSGFENTRIDILSGSVVFDSGNAAPGPPITLGASGATIRIEKPSRVRIDSDAAQVRVEKGEAILQREGSKSKVGPDQMVSLTGASVARRMTDVSDDALDLWSQQRNRMIFLGLASNRSITDPGTDPSFDSYSGDYGAVASADPGAWVGYIPPATVLPMTGSYTTALPGYGWYYPAMISSAIYGPIYGGVLYRSLMYGRTNPAYAGFHPTVGYTGLVPGSTIGITPGYISPGMPGRIGVFTPRPIGGRIGMPPGGGIGGISVPRPGMGAGHPIAVPRGAIHR